MKKLVYYIASLVIFASCSSSGVVISEKELPEEIFYLPNQLKPYTGKCVMYFSNTDVVKQAMTFKNGKLEGTLTNYYSNGNIKRKGEYRNGLYNGKWEQFAEDGKKMYEVHYKNDTLCGDFITWHPTGVLKQKGIYAENSKSGLWTEYDEAGMIIKKMNYN